MRRSYFIKQPNTACLTSVSFSQRESRQAQAYLAILLGRTVGGGVAHKLFKSNRARTKLQRTSFSYLPQTIQTEHRPSGVLANIAYGRFTNHVYFSTSKFGVAASKQIGISRLVWFTLLRLVRTQKLTFLQKKNLAYRYDSQLRGYFSKLRKLEGFRNWIVSESSNIHFILNKTYKWLHHAFRFFQKHKRNLQSVSNYRTVRMGRCFLTPFLMRKLSRVQTIRKIMTFSFREWKKYYRNMRNVLSNSTVRSVLWNTIGRRGLSKLGTYVRKGQMFRLTAPKSTVEALTFGIQSYNPLIKINSTQISSNPLEVGSSAIGLKNFLSTEPATFSDLTGSWESAIKESSWPLPSSQGITKNKFSGFSATKPSRKANRNRLLKIRTGKWCGLKSFDRLSDPKHPNPLRTSLADFIKNRRVPTNLKGSVGRLLASGRRYQSGDKFNVKTLHPSRIRTYAARRGYFACDAAAEYRLRLTNERRGRTNHELANLFSEIGGQTLPSITEIRYVKILALSFLLSSDKRVLLANQIALRSSPVTSQLNYAEHLDIIGARVANKNKVKIFRQRFYKRRLLKFFKKWQFASRILQIRTLLFKPQWVLRKINRKARTNPITFRTYAWMVRLFGYRYLFKINGRYRRMLFNSKKRKAKRKNATNPKGPQHLKFKYQNRRKKWTRKDFMRRFFLKFSKKGRRRFLFVSRNLSAARSSSTAIRIRSRFLSARHISLLKSDIGGTEILKSTVLNNIGLPRKFSGNKPAVLVDRGVGLKPKPLLHWQLPLMDQIRIRNRERAERLIIRSAMLERLRRKTQEPFDLKKFQAEGFARATANPALNTYRDIKILKYVYSGMPDPYKLMALLGVYRRQQKRDDEIKARSAQKLKWDRLKFFKKSTNRREVRNLSLRARRRSVSDYGHIAMTLPFAGSVYLDNVSSKPTTPCAVPSGSKKKFYKLSTRLRMAGSYRMYNLVRRRLRTKEKNLNILNTYRCTKEKRKRPKIVWVVGGSNEDSVESNRKPSDRLRGAAWRKPNLQKFAYQKIVSGTCLLYRNRHFRYRKYLSFLEQSTLFQYLSRYCIYKMGLVKGVWQKIIPTSRKTVSAFGLRKQYRKYRPVGVRLNQYTRYANASITSARARQKMKVKRAIFYTDNKISVHNLWESMTRVYPSFGYFRKIRLEKRRERLMLKNRTKPLRFDIFHKDLGAYWGPRVLSVRTLALRKMRASLATDNISQCIFWKKAIQFFYTNRFLKGFKQKRIRVPQGLPYLVVSKLMPNIKRLRVILKEEIKIMKLKRVKLFPKFMYARKRMKVFKETPYEYRAPNFRFAALRFLQNGKRRLPPYWHRTRKKKFPLKSQKKDWTKSMGFWYSPVRSIRESVTYLEGSVSYRPGKYSIALTRVLERFNLERELSLMLRFRKNKPLIFLPYVHYVQWWRYRRLKFETTLKRRMRLYGLRGRGSKKIWFGKLKVNKSAIAGLKCYAQLTRVQDKADIRGCMGGLNSTMTSFNIIMGKFYSRLQNLNDYSTTSTAANVLTRLPNRPHRSKNDLGGYRYNVTFSRAVYYDKISLFHFTNSVFRTYVQLFASANILLNRYSDRAGPNLFARKLVLFLLNYSMYSKNAYFVTQSGGVSERSLRDVYLRYSKNLGVLKRLTTGLLFDRVPTSRLNHLKIRYVVPSRKNILVKYLRGFLISKTTLRNAISVW